MQGTRADFGKDTLGMLGLAQLLYVLDVDPSLRAMMQSPCFLFCSYPLLPGLLRLPWSQQFFNLFTEVLPFLVLGFLKSSLVLRGCFVSL